MYYEFIQKNKRRVAAIVAIILIVIAVGTIALYAGRAGKTAVVVSSVPSDAQVTFNGQPEGNGTQWLVDGTYKVIAKKDGYDTLTKTIQVVGAKSQNVVALSLTGKSDEAKKWQSDHADEYVKNEAYGAIEANSNGAYFSAQNPITTKLPFQDPYFTIGYITNDDQSVTLTITTPSPRYRFYAIEKIRTLGYNPTDFKIVFKDFHNPLSVGVQK